MNNYLSVLKKYAVFGGRAGLSEFWMFILINIVVSIVLSFLSITLGYLYNFAVIIPSLAVGARRLHDTGRSGWWQLIGLIPLVGWIAFIVLMAMKGQAADNAYGPGAPGSASVPVSTPPPATPANPTPAL